MFYERRVLSPEKASRQVLDKSIRKKSPQDRALASLCICMSEELHLAMRRHWDISDWEWHASSLVSSATSSSLVSQQSWT